MGDLVVPDGIAGAVLSERPHSRAEPLRRYLLWRIWKPDAPRALFIGLNPSTADAMKDDPTVRKLAGFTRREGAGGFELVNLISERATDPSDVHGDPEPEEADRYIEAALQRCSIVVAVWGEGSKLCKRARDLALERDAFVTVAAESAGRDLLCLGVTKGGQPRHPLYLAGDTKLESFHSQNQWG